MYGFARVCKKGSCQGCLRKWRIMRGIGCTIVAPIPSGAIRFITGSSPVVGRVEESSVRLAKTSRRDCPVGLVWTLDAFCAS